MRRTFCLLAFSVSLLGHTKTRLTTLDRLPRTELTGGSLRSHNFGRQPDNPSSYIVFLDWDTYSYEGSITVLDPESKAEMLLFQGFRGCQSVYGLKPGKTYKFSLWEARGEFEQWKLLDTVTVTVPSPTSESQASKP